MSELTAPGTRRQVVQVSLGRLPIAVLAAAVLSAAANTLLGLAAVALFDIPAEFEPLAPSAPAPASVVSAVGAGIVLAGLALLTRRPVQYFYWVSIGFLALSFIPVLALAVTPQYPGTTIASIGTVALMHVVAFVTIVPLLTRIASRSR